MYHIVHKLSLAAPIFAEKIPLPFRSGTNVAREALRKSGNKFLECKPLR